MVGLLKDVCSACDAPFNLLEFSIQPAALRRQLPLNRLQWARRRLAAAWRRRRIGDNV